MCGVRAQSSWQRGKGKEGEDARASASRYELTTKLAKTQNIALPLENETENIEKGLTKTHSRTTTHISTGAISPHKIQIGA